MTVKELIEKLQTLPEDLPVVLRTDDYFGYYDEVEEVDCRQVYMDDYPNHTKKQAVVFAIY